MTRSTGEKWAAISAVATAVAALVALAGLLYGDDLACDLKLTSSCKPERSSAATSAGVTPLQTTELTPASTETDSQASNQAVITDKEMTIEPPVCATKGVDLDTLQVGNFPDEAELAMVDESCVRDSGEAYLSAVQQAPLTHISPKPGPIPTLEECIQGLQTAPSDDIRGVSSAGGTLCFRTTNGLIAGVALLRSS